MNSMKTMPWFQTEYYIFSLFSVTGSSSYLYLEHSATTYQNNDRNHTLSISGILFQANNPNHIILD